MSAQTQASPVTAGQTGTTVLKVEGLTVDLRTGRGTVRAVDNVGFEARAGETLALLGESGCGKSMTAKAVAGLLDPIADVTGGEIVLNGTDLAALSPRQRRKFAGPELGIVFQDALTALNPVYPVGTQLGEAFRIGVRVQLHPGFLHPPVSERDHLAELPAGVHVQHRDRRPCRVEGLHQQVQQDRAVLAHRVHHHRVGELRGDLAQDVDALCLQPVKVGHRLRIGHLV